MKSYRISYFLLPSEIRNHVELRQRTIKADDYDHAWSRWNNMIEDEKLDVDPEWLITDCSVDPPVSDELKNFLLGEKRG